MEGNTFCLPFSQFLQWIQDFPLPDFHLKCKKVKIDPPPTVYMDQPYC
jgi:hypothetical protein